MALTYYGTKNNAYGASASSSDPYFAYQTFSSAGTAAGNSVSAITACSISNANTNGSSTNGYRMNIEALLGSTWYTVGYITVDGQKATHQKFSNFTATADATLKSLMGKTALSGLRGKAVNGYFHLNTGSALSLSAATVSDASACTAPTSLSVSAELAESNVSLQGSGAAAGTGNTITGYEIQYADSTDQTAWGSWTALAAVSASSASFTTSVAPSARGYYRKFRARTQGSAGSAYYSGWKETTNNLRRYALSALSLNKSELAAGTAITANLTAKEAGLTHRVTWKFKNRTDIRTLGGGVSTDAWAIPLEWLDQISDAVSGGASCTLETLLNGTVLGSVSAAFTITCPMNITPSIAGMTVNPVSDTVPVGWELYVKGQSRVNLTLNGVLPGTGSRIVSYSITGGGFASGTAELTTGPINTAGEIMFTAVVTDARGRSAKLTKTVTFADYEHPKITALTAKRVDAQGIEDNNGTRIAGFVNYGYSKIVTNEAKIWIYVNGSAVISGDTLSANAIIYSYELNGPYGTSNSYTVKAVITDTIGAVQATAETVVSTAKRIVSFGSGVNGGAAFGKMAEKDKCLDVSAEWDVDFGKPLAIASGGTGQTTKAAVRNTLGLGNTTGALPLANGGTGQTTAAGAMQNLVTGGSLAAPGSVLSLGASGWTTYYTTPQALRNTMGLGNTTGALPLANGGTGQTTAAAARNALGLGSTTGALAIDNGGTGATTAAAARTNLGITPANIGAAAATHNQAAGTINSGKLAEAQLPYVVRRGTATITGVNWLSVSFSGFTNTPTIVVSFAQNAATSGIAVLKTQSESSTGFQVCMAGSSGSGNRAVNWIAIGT